MKKDVVITWRPVTATGSTALTLANEKKGEKKTQTGNDETGNGQETRNGQSQKNEM